jgi:hypothetical protein
MIEVVSSKLKKDGRFHLLFIFIVHVQDLKQLKRTPKTLSVLFEITQL